MEKEEFFFSNLIQSFFYSIFLCFFYFSLSLLFAVSYRFTFALFSFDRRTENSDLTVEGL